MRSLRDFHVGDWVEIICHDGKRFEGVLMYFNDTYVVLNGYGFPLADIRAMM